MTDDTPDTDDVTDGQCAHDDVTRGVFVAGSTGAGGITLLTSRMAAIHDQAGDEAVPQWIDPASGDQCAGGDEE